MLKEKWIFYWVVEVVSCQESQLSLCSTLLWKLGVLIVSYTKCSVLRIFCSWSEVSWELGDIGVQCPVRLKRCPESELSLEEGDLEMICELSLERGSWNRVVMGVSCPWGEYNRSDVFWKWDVLDVNCHGSEGLSDWVVLLVRCPSNVLSLIGFSIIFVKVWIVLRVRCPLRGLWERVFLRVNCPCSEFLWEWVVVVLSCCGR